MFRIDTSQSKSQVTSSSSGTFTPKTLYCNWITSTSTSRHGDGDGDGDDDNEHNMGDDDNSRRILFSVGRSNADINFENDRCVSRRHCRVWIENGDGDGHQYRLFVEDQGSKFGSFVRLPDQQEDASSFGSTNTEELNNYSQVSSSAKTEKLKPNVPFELELDHGSSTRPSSILLRCGVTGSRIIITRCPLVICITTSIVSSKSDPKQVKIMQKLKENGHKIGAQVMTTWDSGLCTHLVTKDSIAPTTKVLCAWVLRRPIVTLNWVEAMFIRTNIAQVLPNELDFEPSYPSNFHSDQSQPRNILRDTRIILLEDGDFYQLCLSAGAKHIVKAFELPDNEFFGGSWLDNVIEEIKDQVLSPLGFLEPKKRVSEGLNKRTEYLRNRNIPMTSSKQLAKCITSLTKLLDYNGDEFRYNANVKPTHSKNLNLAANVVEDAIEENIQKSGDERHYRYNTTAKPTNSNNSNLEANIGEDAIVNNLLKSRDKKCSVSAESNENIHRAVMSSKRLRKTDNEETVSKRCRVADKEEVVQTEFDADVPQELVTHLPLDKTEQSDGNGLDRNKSGALSGRKVMQVNSDGWCVNQHSSSDNDYDKNRASDNVSEFRSDLIVKRSKSSLLKHPSKYGNPSGRCTRDGFDLPNFKRFRKNRIIKSRITPVEMQNMLPKQTDVQRAMEQTQKEIDRENEAADELFADNGGTSAFRKFGFSQHTSKSRNLLKTGRRR